jgi:hypothetical protein
MFAELGAVREWLVVEFRPSIARVVRVIRQVPNKMMNRYVVHYVFQKGSSKAVGTETVEADSDFMAKQIAEGKARQKYSRDGYMFLVTRIETR